MCSDGVRRQHMAGACTQFSTNFYYETNSRLTALRKPGVQERSLIYMRTQLNTVTLHFILILFQ
jgi:hypothetical protein